MEKWTTKIDGALNRDPKSNIAEKLGFERKLFWFEYGFRPHDRGEISQIIRLLEYGPIDPQLLWLNGPGLTFGELKMLPRALPKCIGIEYIEFENHALTPSEIEEFFRSVLYHDDNLVRPIKIVVESQDPDVIEVAKLLTESSKNSSFSTTLKLNRYYTEELSKNTSQHII